MANQENTASQQAPQSEMEKGRDIFTGIAIRGAVSLQNALDLKDDTFRMVVGHTHQDVRACYLYGVLDELLKASTAMLRWQGLLQESEKDHDQLQEIQKNSLRIMFFLPPS